MNEQQGKLTKEEKIKLRQERSYRRKGKRIAKDIRYRATARTYDRWSISWGRRKEQGKVMTCEMGYYDCERRGYCNGDC